MSNFADIEFEGTTSSTSIKPDEATTNVEEHTIIDGKPEVEDVTLGNNSSEVESNSDKVEKDTDNSSTGGLEVGTEISFDNINYIVDENGNVINAETKEIFKDKDDVADWLKELEIKDSDNTNEVSIETVQEAMGVEIKDENGNVIEFTNDSAGVKSYIDKVIELREADIRNAAIDELYKETPIVKNFIDYITVNGGNPQGFGEINDRRGIEVEETNVAQQEAIIREAHKEFGRKGSVDTYIKYLKDTNALLDVSKEELAALQEKDEEYEASIAEAAKAERAKEVEEVTKYWGQVKKNIDNRVIAGFKIPESLVIERDGAKITATPNDFFNYLSRTDSKTKTTAYQRDLSSMTEDEVMNADILDAWLHFTGGSYKDLVKMAINEEQVKKLVLTAKNKKTTKTAVISKPKGKNNVNDIVL